MTNVIVERDSPVTLVGAGALSAGDFAAARAVAPSLVAADGGAAHALAAGHMPDAVIGDLDSLEASVRAQLPAEQLHHLREQTTTDFDKALRMIRAPVVVGIGFLGARLDHQLAALSILMQRHPSPCVLLGANEVVFHVPETLSLPLTAGEIVSLFPMQRVRGRSVGLEWPIDGLELDPLGRIGTSNRALGPLRLEMEGPGLLAMVPRARLEQVVAALWSQ
ncbi:thiamine diphosphokinase [Phaeobacter sp.]|uniref:thiamine diphosphokinase n=1 Tax=Phaeobacter sp. TaxID=1902409 RepID=UPI0025E2F837|nr:thiamine diphosphokinase [Phaeobacter sp.]